MGTGDNFEVFEDTSFVTGDSPVTLDFRAVLGRQAESVSVINDGTGDFTVAISEDGQTFGGDHTMKKGEHLVLTGRSVDSIRITWVANSAYRVVYE